MSDIKLLKDKFDSFNVNRSNRQLYEKLIDLDRSVYKPLMDKILAGQLDIEDTRPIFSFFYDFYGENKRLSGRRNILNHIIKTNEMFVRNLRDRLFHPENYVNETYIENEEYESIKEFVINSHEEVTKKTMTEEDKQKVILALDTLLQVDFRSAGERSRVIVDSLKPGHSTYF